MSALDESSTRITLSKDFSSEAYPTPRQYMSLSSVTARFRHHLFFNDMAKSLSFNTQIQPRGLFYHAPQGTHS